MYKLKSTELETEYVDFFVKQLGIYPVGTVLKLRTGEVGVVVEINRGDIMRPLLRAIFNRSGERYFGRRLIDLAERDEQGEYIYNILRVLDPKSIGVDINTLLGLDESFKA